MSNGKIEVSIVIVSYNTKQLLQNCLESVIKQTHDVSYEIIVSDNGSTDGSIQLLKEKFPSIILIENNENLGFGAANNRGLAFAKGKYIFYLNSDTVLLNNAVKIFFDYWEENNKLVKIGGLGGVLLNENMEPIHSCANFPTYGYFCSQIYNQLKFHFIKSFIQFFNLKKFYESKRKEYSYKENVPVGKINGYITGADLFLKNNKYAIFDEKYFMYCEETDLELKLANEGYNFFIIEGPKIQHLTRKIGNGFHIVNFAEICIQNSALYYCKKNLQNKVFLLRFLIYIDRLNKAVRQMVKKVPVK